MPLSEARRLNLREIVLQPVAVHEEGRFRTLMEAHHYLGALAKIGHTLWYVATWNGQWLALLSFPRRPGSARRVTSGSGGISATNTTAYIWSPTTAGF